MVGVDFSISNFQNVEKKDGKLKRFAKSNIALATGTVASTVTLPVSHLLINKMAAISTKLSPEEITQVNESAKNMLNGLNLDKKGVQIVDYRGSFRDWITGALSSTKENLSSSYKEMLGGVTKNNKSIMLKFKKVLKEAFREMVDPSYAIAKGKNAAFSPVSNIVIYNHEKLSLAAFHEIGHAFNKNSSKFWSGMQKMRNPLTAIALLIAMLPAFTKKTVPTEEKELTKFQKVKNKVRDNAGKLAFVSMLPIIAEEGMASIRGCKWANANLPKHLSKKVLKSNGIGMCSYVLGAVGVAVMAMTARAVKDKLITQKQQNTLG